MSMTYGKITYSGERLIAICKLDTPMTNLYQIMTKKLTRQKKTLIATQFVKPPWQQTY